MGVTETYSRESIRFPPSGFVWVPRAGRREAAAGLSMYSPCAPLVVLAQRALYAAVRTVGPWVMPGPRATWAEPAGDAWDALCAAWRATLGEWDAVALYHRPDRGRTGFALLLLREGRALAFVRVATDPSRTEREFAVLAGLHAAAPRSFVTAAPIAHGEVDGWGWLATESVPNYPLGALRRAETRHTVAGEIGAVLAGILERPAGTPEHWIACHGDLSPWNLRTSIRGTVWVIDWEDAAWAPPGVDLLYGDLTAHTTFGSPLPAQTSAEAAEWVGAILSARLTAGEDRSSINNRLLAALAQVPRDQEHYSSQ